MSGLPRTKNALRATGPKRALWADEHSLMSSLKFCEKLIFKGLDLVCNDISTVQLLNTCVDTIKLLMVLNSGFNFRTVLIGGFLQVSS
jgi:hypothetical protein